MANSDVKVAPLEAKVMGINIFPIFKGVFKIMNRTEEKRRQTLIKMNAPKSDDMWMDMYDGIKENPYKIEEVLENKVWKVMYRAEDFAVTKVANRKMQGMFFGDPETPAYQNKLLASARKYGEACEEQVKKDIERIIKNYKKPSWTAEEKFQVPTFDLNMIVIKLNSGGLALYNPCKLHKKDAPQLIADWLDSLGPVQWLINASSAHTMFMGNVMADYPEAKVIGPEYAQEKIKFAKQMGEKSKYDYVSDFESEMSEANRLLESEGLELVDIKGDCGTSAIVGVAHKEVAIECDIVYGHHDGVGLLMTNEAEFKALKPDDMNMRMFKFTMIDKPNSPLGFLPNYRFWMMDPTSMGLMFSWNKPRPQDKLDMAESLRKVNRLTFNKAVGVHMNVMSGDDFRKSVDACWNWLDGKPLI